MMEKWKTSITKIEPNKILVRGYPVDKLMMKISFAEAVYLILKGELPPKEIGRLMNAILVSSIDHGVTPPSTLAARTIASTGASLGSAVAGGILAISRFHGGAIEDAMQLFMDGVKRCEETGKSEGEVAKEIVSSLKEKKKRAAGFGHRIHTEDPRTKRLFELAEEAGLEGKYIKFAKAVENALFEITGKKLPINVDGAIAALLCELGFSPVVGNAFFMLARLPGLVAHVFEETMREKPMRRIDPSNFEYDGPEERDV
jgi:citrate synthase